MTIDETPLEREHELAELAALIDATVAGAGRLLLIEGPAGIGKTLLLRWLRRAAARRNILVLAARGGELEQDFGFGIVRQLFDPLLLSGDRREKLFGGAAGLAEPVFNTAPESPGADASHAVLHGLYWLVVNLAQSSPVIFAVDDLHWADQPSIRFLIHLARRLDGLPVAVAVSSRTEDPATHDYLQRTLRAEASPPVLRPAPLSSEATDRLVESRLGVDVDPELRAACHEASGGNPFLITELLEELRALRAQRSVVEPRRVREIGPERIASALLMRIGAVDHDAPALARAVAVLGAEAQLEHAAELAELPLERSHAVAARLRDVGVLELDEPFRFVHPIMRSAIYEDIPAAVRLALHRRAATVLRKREAEPEALAVHLLATDPAGDDSAIETLRDAARAAAARGAPETAVRYLRRALLEPPIGAIRATLLLELGRMERELGLREAAAHLREAVDAAPSARLRAEAVEALNWAAGPHPEAQRQLIPLYREAAEAVSDEDRELFLKLEAQRLAALLFLAGDSPRFGDDAERFRDLPGDSAAECLLLSICAYKLLLEGRTASAVAEVATRAARHIDLTEPGPHSIWLLLTILWLPDRGGLQSAFERRIGDEIVAASKRGLANAFAWNSTLRAHLRNVIGDLRGAEADARSALESGGLAGAFPYGSIIPLILSLAEQGKTAEAEALLRERGLIGELPPARPYMELLASRARMHAVAGNVEAARSDLDEALLRIDHSRSGGAAELHVWLEAALIHHALADDERARKLSDHAVALAEAWGSERALGGAMRVAGIVRGGDEGLHLLEQAVDMLGRSPAAVWHAGALVDLGAALRRAGRRYEARPRLEKGMDLAHRCGATPLVDRALEELTSMGARPRRFAISGIDSLTPSERRVAGLAAKGMTNKEIAQALFVTLRTVEMHLSTCYRKLGISSRRQLQQALDAEQ